MKKWENKNEEWLDKGILGSYNKAIDKSDAKDMAAEDTLLQRDVHLLRVRQEHAAVTPFKLPRRMPLVSRRGRSTSFVNKC